MDDDDRMDRGPNGIVRIVIFALVGMIMVTTVAIPILATVGERTSTEYNEGIRMSCPQEHLSEIFNTADVNNLYINLSSQSMRITYYIGDDFYMETLLASDDLVEGIAYIIVDPIVYEYNSDAIIYGVYDGTSISRYTVDMDQQPPNSFPCYDIAYNPSPEPVLKDWWIFIQDPDGDYVLTDDGVHSSDSDVMSFTPSDDLCIWTDGTEGYEYVWNNDTCTKTTGTADITSENGIVDTVTFDGRESQYLIGPYSYQVTENILDGTPIGTMIGMIPLLMVVGIVLFIANRSKLSDR